METVLYQTLALLVGFVFFYSIFAGAVGRTWISGPIVFVAFGMLIGPVGFGLAPFETERGSLRTLAELTLALVLFTDAAGSDLKVLRRTAALPVRRSLRDAARDPFSISRRHRPNSIRFSYRIDNTS